jgi:hypothetical protein
MNITDSNATVTEFTHEGCPTSTDIHYNDLNHNILCLSTAEGTTTDGIIFGLPHYLEIFDLTPTTSGDPLTIS